jgi:hypothetical protein
VAIPAIMTAVPELTEAFARRPGGQKVNLSKLPAIGFHECSAFFA